MTTCITAPTPSAPTARWCCSSAGTKLVGETRGEVQQGAARVFVLWTQARTPTGVWCRWIRRGLTSSAAPALPGEVNRHFWQRFGAAMLISLIDGAVQAARAGIRAVPAAR